MDVSRLFDKCERFKLASFGGDDVDSATLGRIWRALCSKVASVLAAGKTAVLPQFARFGVRKDTGAGVFDLQDVWTRRFGVSWKHARYCAQGADVQVAPMDLAMAAGTSRDVVQIALKELYELIGLYGGRNRQALRVPFDRVGTLSFSGGVASFRFQGGLSAPSSSAHAGTATRSSRPPTKALRKSSSLSKAGMASLGASASTSRSRHPLPPPSPVAVMEPPSRQPSYRGPTQPAASPAAASSGRMSTSRPAYSVRSDVDASRRGGDAGAGGSAVVPPLQLRGQGRARGKAVSGREALEYNMKMEAEKRTAADRAREEAKHEYAAVKKDTKAFLRKEKRENRRRREEADVFAADQRAKLEAVFEASRPTVVAAAEPDEEDRWVFQDPVAVERHIAEVKAKQRADLDAQLGRTAAEPLPPKRLGGDGGIAPHGPHFPTFLRPDKPAKGKVNPGARQAARLVRKQAEQRVKDEVRRKKEMVAKLRRDADEVAAREEARDRAKDKRSKELQRKQNAELAEQMRLRNEERAREKSAFFEDGPPDPSHVQPMGPTKDADAERKAKERLRRELAEQIELKHGRLEEEKRMERMQDQVRLESLFQEVHKDYRSKGKGHAKKNQAVHREWEHQSRTLKQLRKLDHELGV